MPVHSGLATRIARLTEGTNRHDSAIPGLSFHRWPHPTEPTSYTMPASICLIGQGAKTVALGEQQLDFDASHFLITSVGLPVMSRINTASEEMPYLGLTLELDLQAISQAVLSETLPAPTSGSRDTLGIAVSSISPAMQSAFERLIDLLDTPADIPALAPLVKQEIWVRLLSSEQGPRLRRIITADTHSHRIASAIDWLTENYREPFRAEPLAKRAGLSISAFHSHFRAMTSVSPLQFQKRLRLTEARRLMFSEHLDAASAAISVGYESPSQFSREYSRLFGAPPLRDIRRLTGVDPA
ncbi:AraC family transcriptional regulator [Parvularcula flava]|uniref:AraC family transcriptional regulator n=3 Tax=Aquisalinus luteolus TaxID=1566827 RepID=A0ABX0HR22_9PROT|nr:AraC family transcriptional regulator [Aquisalinus luteolus]